MKEKKLLELHSFLSLRGTTPRLSFVFHQIQIKYVSNMKEELSWLLTEWRGAQRKYILPFNR